MLAGGNFLGWKLIADRFDRCLDVMRETGLYVCIYRLHSYESTSIGWTEEMNTVTVSVGSWSDDGRLFNSFGAQAAKLCGPKLEVDRQALVDPRKWQGASGGDWYSL